MFYLLVFAASALIIFGASKARWRFGSLWSMLITGGAIFLSWNIARNGYSTLYTILAFGAGMFVGFLLAILTRRKP